jgi:acyl-CoA synthetase (AMP-forming)/AMP-acid ligase II
VANLQEIEAQLIAEGGPCELCEDVVLGARMQVFKRRAPSLRALVQDSARFADVEYLVYEDRRITYAEHLRLVASVARALEERYGVRPGDRVAILAANCPEWIISFWAATSLGAIAVGMNGWWTGDETVYGLEDCEPKLLIGDAKRLARLAGTRVPVPVVEVESEFEKLTAFAPDAELPSVPIAEDDPACILYTSGTTGRPKGAVNTHRNIVAVLGLQFFHGLRMLMLAAAEGKSGGPPSTANCMLVTTPLFHVSGLYAGAVATLTHGVTTVLTAGRYDPVRVMQLIEREKVTSWGPMGTMAHRLVTHPDVAKYDLSSVRMTGSGGAPMTRELQERLRQVFPNARASLGLGYGLTECTALATLSFGRELEEYPDSSGRPLPTMQVELRDPEGKTLPEGQEGEVCLRGPVVMREYWRRPEDTEATIRLGRWLHTGDIGRLEEGRLYINSRARDMILRGSENIYPIEIEQRLEAHPDVEEAAVVGVDHPELGQEVKAILVPRRGAKLETDELAKWVAEKLAYFKVPAHWELRSKPLPRNAAGKVLKQVLISDAANPFVED